MPMIADAMVALRKAGLEVALFSDVKPNPIARNVEAGVKVLRAGKHDGVIAWGGGSGIDTAKAIAFMAGQTRPLWDFEDVGDWWTRANPAGIYPSIAVPTTAGTGSETGRASVITNEETHTKKVIFHPKMMPSIVIADPELTVGLPPKLTAGTGMDAFIHCLEAYCAPGGLVVQHPSRIDQCHHSSVCHDVQPSLHRREGPDHRARPESAGAQL